jgi:hypothetical protein
MLLETIALLAVIATAGVVCIAIVRVDWRRYGFLYLLSATTAVGLCYMFTYVGFYRFPVNLLHGSLLIPYGLVTTAFPSAVLFGVRYSPERWAWKIPFYWALIHIGVLGELLLLSSPILVFSPEWDLWDSYTLWWLYYLLFEALGGKLIPSTLRKPLNTDALRYGRWAWIVLHVIVIGTIFLAGVYFGVTVL